MNSGDKVINKKTNQALTIKKNYGAISSCWIPEPYYLFDGIVKVEAMIFKNSNLISENSQLTLF